MIYCPHCGKRNEPETLDCSCGEPLPAALPAAPLFAYTPSAAQFALLYFLTVGLYGIYWYFKLWRVTAAMQLKDEHPWRSTLLMLVPIYNIYLYFNLFSEVKGSLDQARLHPKVPVIVLAIVGAVVTVLYRLPGDYWFICLFAFLPFAIIQYYVTEAQLRLWGDTVRVYKYRWGDWIVITLGTLQLLLILFGIRTDPADHPQPWMLPSVIVLALFVMIVLGRFKPGSSMRRAPEPALGPSS